MVSLTFSGSGNADNTRRLAQLVVPRIVTLRRWSANHRSARPDRVSVVLSVGRWRQRRRPTCHGLTDRTLSGPPNSRPRTRWLAGPWPRRDRSPRYRTRWFCPDLITSRARSSGSRSGLPEQHPSRLQPRLPVTGAAIYRAQGCTGQVW